MKKWLLNEWMVGKTYSKFETSKQELLEKAKRCEMLWPIERIAQVHEILIQNGVIGADVLENGDSSECSWVSEYDWFYQTEFSISEEAEHYILSCKGLDTVCDVFLNGKHLGISESMYLPFKRDITETIRRNGKNSLMFYFHNHAKMVQYYEETMPPEYRGHVPARAMLLKSEDYGTAPDKCRGYWNIGMFDEVCVEGTDGIRPANLNIDVKLGQPFHTYEKATIRLSVSGEAYRDGNLSARFTVCEGGGGNPTSVHAEKPVEKGMFCLSSSLVITNPKLWWPKNYGSHPLYEMHAEIFLDGVFCAQITRTFGIRDIRQTGNMEFICNGAHIRLFGGDISPIYGPSNVFNEQVAFDLIDKLDLAGMNAIRIWGPSKPYPDQFYDRFDELGILVWQDFPTGGSELPNDAHYRMLLNQQAEVMLHRLRHHPSIYLWCGGNENIYMNEYNEKPGNIGYDILMDDFRQLCTRLDPSRVYHVSCPTGGTYTNDPGFGDSHGSRAYRRYLPGEPYGVFYSENIRVYPPQYKSMKRWLGPKLWAEGYVDVKPAGCRKPMPASWAEVLGNFGEEKLGPIHEYYSADNPHDLIYKFTAAASQDIYQMYARCRRGKPHDKSEENNICQGFMIWKSNDPWPAFYCALVDYYGECAMTYYAVKRAIRPVWIDLEVDDHIYLWGVNDTLKAFEGTITLTAFRMDENRISRQDEIPVNLLKNSSRVLTNLDFLGALHWHTVLHACLRDRAGNEILSVCTMLRHENMLPFPDARLELEYCNDIITVRTDQFARCVELSAGEDGEEFGWVFEDNFFDLLPFETKKIAIQRRGNGNCIRAKAQYGSTFAKCRLIDT